MIIGFKIRIRMFSGCTLNTVIRHSLSVLEKNAIKLLLNPPVSVLS